MIYNIKQDPTLTKPKINIFFLYKHNIHIVHITQVKREQMCTLHHVYFQYKEQVQLCGYTTVLDLLHQNFRPCDI